MRRCSKIGVQLGMAAPHFLLDFLVDWADAIEQFADFWAQRGFSSQAMETMVQKLVGERLEWWALWASTANRMG
jgi:hypothetical protein